MIPLLRSVFIALLAVSPITKSRAEEPMPTAVAAKSEEGQTKIEADKASMDFRSGIATFEGNVVVVDKDVTVRSDVLVAHVTEENKLTAMEARGNVVITQKDSDRRATGGYAHYDVDSRKVVLKENPRMEMGDNVLDNAEIITYFLDSEKIFTEGKRQGGGRTTIILPGGTGDNQIAPRNDADE